MNQSKITLKKDLKLEFKSGDTYEVLEYAPGNNLVKLKYPDESVQDITVKDAHVLINEYRKEKETENTEVEEQKSRVRTYFTMTNKERFKVIEDNGKNLTYQNIKTGVPKSISTSEFETLLANGNFKMFNPFPGKPASKKKRSEPAGDSNKFKMTNGEVFIISEKSDTDTLYYTSTRDGKRKNMPQTKFNNLKSSGHIQMI